MNTLTKAQFDEFLAHDLRELFDMMMNHRVYFEAIITQNQRETTIVARVTTFDRETVDFIYDVEAARDNRHLGVDTFFSYDSIDAVRAHACEMLKSEVFDEYV